MIRRDIPLRRSTIVEKDELRNAVKKLLTKLHLVYTNEGIVNNVESFGKWTLWLNIFGGNSLVKNKKSC